MFGDGPVHILSWSPYNIFLVTDRSIYCHMTLSAMNYLLYMDRPSTCIIILDKKYNMANSSCHFGSYGSIWTGPSPKKFGPYNTFWVTDRSIYCHMTLSAMNYLLYIFIRLCKNHNYIKKIIRKIAQYTSLLCLFSYDNY